MIEVIRRLQFCAGHRVLGHEGKCNQPHGHNYVVYLHARSQSLTPLDDVGRVIDFAVLKEKVGGWIDQYWDHLFLVWEKDGALIQAMRQCGGKIFVLPKNPTAENLADYLLHSVCPVVIEKPVEVFQVSIEETENCYATAGFK
jgi:6-pyruvoyltetrahydropterin/6-carboxytetrahydropterin synthase